MEADNSITQFDLDPEAGALVEESLRVMLILVNTDTTLYWLWGDALPAHPVPVGDCTGEEFDRNGFISVFLLGHDGHMVRRMFRVPTTAAVGQANAISLASWSDGFGRMDGLMDMREGTEYTTAFTVAKVDLPDDGCYIMAYIGKS
ncbi:hypothetical protein MFIFM68171_00276 [Madurella fahalii]|uniref:Uncharacterized protein n=1 Tax=Madurella fahalii TaxID=1157608 RepID=A0ABQ0FX59_9PEZI